MGSKTRLSSYCTKRANNGVNHATSRKIITRLACPMFVTKMPRTYDSDSAGTVFLVGCTQLVPSSYSTVLECAPGEGKVLEVISQAKPCNL